MGHLTRTRARDRTGPAEYGEIKPNFALVALPTAISIFTYHYVAAIVIVSIVLASFISDKNRIASLKPTWLCAILPAGALLIILRPNYPTPEIDVFFFLAVLAAIAQAIYRSDSRAGAILSLHDGVGLFLIVSVALWLVGFHTGVAYHFGKNIITGGDRILFPITSTLAMAPTMAAAYMVALPIIMIATRNCRIFRTVAFLSAMVVLIQSDRRSALFAVVFITAIAIAAPLMFRRLAPWIIGVALASPILIVAFPAASGLTSFLAGLMTPFQRTHEDITTLNSRSGIWTKSLEYYQVHIDFVHQMLGYGTYGQVTSGASSAYGSVFASLRSTWGLKSPHSTVLQLLFDGGWITAISFTSTLFCAAWVLARGVSPINLAGLAMLTAMSFVGATENILGPHLTAIPFWMAAVIVTVALSRECPPPRVYGASVIDNTTTHDGAHEHRQCNREVS